MRLLERLREQAETNLWLVPGVLVSLAIASAFGALAIDRAVDTTLGFDGGAEGARNVLSTIAAAMITFTGLVFSITIVALQLASGQYSPRVMRTFLRDRTSKIALATFVATFSFAFVVLRAVRDDFVPGISVNMAIVLVLASVAVFIHYIDHISKAIRVSSVIESVADESRETLERALPADAPEPPPPTELGEPAGVVVNDADPGVVTSVDQDGLVRRAAEADVVLRLECAVGAFVAHGAPLVSVFGRAGAVDEDKLRRLVALGGERTMEQDLAFGLRQLADIAARALSPGTNDPTTAVGAVDQIHDLLRRIATRPIPSGRCADASGRLRLVRPVVTWEDYVALGLDEARLYGSASPQVLRRLRALLEDVGSIAAPERRPPLHEQIRLLDQAAEREFEDGRDVRRASQADEQGIGA